jgi:hypothetical protein
VIFDAGYDVCRLALLFADLPVEMLGRIRSDRVLCFPVPSIARLRSGVHRGTAPCSPWLAREGPARMVSTTTETTRYGLAHAHAWNRLHPRLTHRGAWAGHDGDIPIVEGTHFRLQVSRLPGL